jgi:salicylate hydroxylase
MHRMTSRVLIAGGGMGGLAAALACARAGCEIRLFEQAAVFSEVGAGIQLGPNATRILEQWGLAQSLRDVAAFPDRLRVRSGVDGGQLGVLRLGDVFRQRYGAPYATLHRADLQGLLLDAAQAAGAETHLSSRISEVTSSIDQVGVRLARQETEEHGDLLVGADGVWSSVRSQVFDGPPATFTGHLAFRGLARQADLPEWLRSDEVTVWLGPRMHLVAYPVRRGELLNVVVLVQGPQRGGEHEWDHEALKHELYDATGPLVSELQDLVHAVPGWRLWSLHDRTPIGSAQEMVRGRVVLLGDAAHPMRPYFAQGAGMAIEDAMELGRVLADATSTDAVPGALQRYADRRWQRCGRVQSLSRRNGRVFHATGFVRWGRDLSMRLLGESLLDQPWLYGQA